MKNLNKKSWYTILISLLIIWLLLVLSTWILNMIMTEMKDNNGMWDNIKAYAWAESAQELALLKIKEKWYAYYDKIDHSINNRSIVLWKNSIDISKFNKWKEVFLSYDIWSKVSAYTWTLQPLWYDIIPLFYIDDSWEKKVNNIDLSRISWIDESLVWNIIWSDSGLSWNWFNNNWVKKVLNWFNELEYNTDSINNFINSSNNNYLVLFNWENTGNIVYNLKSLVNWEYFSKPKSVILSSWEIGDYKQNLETTIDNTAFLNILKYSIYSN